MTSPYLDTPLVPLAVALPQLLENIVAGLANREREDAEKQRLRQRAELICRLLASSPAVPRPGAFIIGEGRPGVLSLAMDYEWITPG